MTDQDLYATVLGKAFHGVSAMLCGHDAEARAQAVADYIHRELRRMVKDLDGCCSGIVRDLEHSGSLLGRDALQERVDRASTESIGTQHIADAVRHACEREGTPQAFLRRLAELEWIQFIRDSRCGKIFATISTAAADLTLFAPTLSSAMNDSWLPRVGSASRPHRRGRAYKPANCSKSSSLEAPHEAQL